MQGAKAKQNKRTIKANTQISKKHPQAQKPMPKETKN